ncbi:YjgN family protein [Hydrogenophaga electricum]|uniref:YjgN family protein n=1 Tax=Hydrogenophaga electricum TaxID=1230953 RepID=UPI0024E0FF29|nr:YjgN family protein [Hydrogenophaga electricum]
MPFPNNHAPSAGAATVRHLPITFTGSGSEYFRIWIVNLLLLFVTLGLYWPWAKVRRLRYFWANTLVDGDPLGFHGEARQMFKGWVLVGVLFVLYNWASSFSAIAGLVAFVALAALWPALWRSSLAFRLGNTSWRGLRFRFVGSLRDAYLTQLPSFLAALPLVLLSFALPEDPDATPPAWWAGVFGGALLLFLLTLPWLFWRMKAYQHRHYSYAGLQTDFRAGLGAFYLIALKPLLVLLALVGLSMLYVGLRFAGGIAWDGVLWVLFRVLPMLFAGAGLLMFFVIGPWLTARLQNLVWTKTGNAQMRFISQLGFRRLLLLGFKNGLLIALTLGLYWPFAKVAVARLRLEAVHIRSVIDMEALAAAEHEQPGEAAGEAAGDLFGLDMGL